MTNKVGSKEFDHFSTKNDPQISKGSIWGHFARNLSRMAKSLRGQKSPPLARATPIESGDLIEDVQTIFMKTTAQLTKASPSAQMENVKPLPLTPKSIAFREQVENELDIAKFELKELKNLGSKKTDLFIINSEKLKEIDAKEAHIQLLEKKLAYIESKRDPKNLIPVDEFKTAMDFEEDTAYLKKQRNAKEVQKEIENLQATIKGFEEESLSDDLFDQLLIDLGAHPTQANSMITTPIGITEETKRFDQLIEKASSFTGADGKQIKTKPEEIKAVLKEVFELSQKDIPHQLLKQVMTTLHKVKIDQKIASDFHLVENYLSSKEKVAQNKNFVEDFRQGKITLDQADQAEIILGKSQQEVSRLEQVLKSTFNQQKELNS